MKLPTLIRILAWLILVLLTGVMIRNNLIYFSAPRMHPFVWEKGALAEHPFWLACLVIHVGAGLVCLAASFLQFFRPMLRHFPFLHRWLGRIYMISVLAFLAPTGFYLAFFANGGTAGIAGFLLLGVLTTVTTWKGWMAMRAGRTAEHLVWMIRSFAMITTALSFRTEHIIFQMMGIQPETCFLMALYLSILGNALVAECLILRIRKPKNRNRIHHHENKSDIPVPAGIR